MTKIQQSKSIASLKVKRVQQSKSASIKSKGKKDRYVTIAERTKKIIKIYNKKYAPEQYLIEGHKGGTCTASSIRKFLNNTI